MSIEIVEPQEGKVTLTLSWKDAEILTRIVGLTNTGNIEEHSPVLLEFVTSMVEHVGRSTSVEVNRYLTETRGKQVYIIDLESGNV